MYKESRGNPVLFFLRAYRKVEPVDNSVQRLPTRNAVIEQAGFTPKQVQRFETLAAHPEIVEQAKAEALKDDSFQQYILKEEKENDQ